MQPYEGPPQSPAQNSNGQSWSFGAFALGCVGWLTLANGVVGFTSFMFMYIVSNKGNPSAAALPFLVIGPLVVFGGVLAAALVLARRSGKREVLHGVIAAAVLSFLTAALLLLLFGSAIFLLGHRS
ncbi:MAG: hypothetical protein IPK60_25065 [Sandaracinaceae bacterium]|jgi:hypothetical protein|nr:hypothetical protein [Sandaracinaceae bacterium]